MFESLVSRWWHCSVRLRNQLDMEPTWQIRVRTRPVELQVALVRTRLSDSMLAPCKHPAATACSLCHATPRHHAFSTTMDCISSLCLPKQTSCPVNCFYLLFYDSDEVNGQCIDKIPLSGRSESHYLGRFSTNTQVFFFLFKLFPAYSTMTAILHQCPL